MVRDTTRLVSEMTRREPVADHGARPTGAACDPPWVRHLNDDETREFAAEWLGTLSAAADMDNNAAVEGVVAAWQQNGQTSLTRNSTQFYQEHDKGDYGPVPPPEVPE